MQGCGGRVSRNSALCLVAGRGGWDVTRGWLLWPAQPCRNPPSGSELLILCARQEAWSCQTRPGSPVPSTTAMRQLWGANAQTWELCSLFGSQAASRRHEAGETEAQSYTRQQFSSGGDPGSNLRSGSFQSQLPWGLPYGTSKDPCLLPSRKQGKRCWTPKDVCGLRNLLPAQLS